MKTHRHFSLLAAVFVISSAAGAFASSWHSNDNAVTPDLDDQFQSPPVNEKVDVAGFKLIVDRTQLGFSVFPRPEGNILGTLSGHDFNVQISRVPTTAPLTQLAAQPPKDGSSVVRVTSAHAGGGLQGVCATYGGKPSFFSSHIRSMNYYYVNPSGETICFSANANTAHPDWEYFQYLMTKMLDPERA